MLLNEEEIEQLIEAVRLPEDKKNGPIQRFFNCIMFRIWLTKIFPRNDRKELIKNIKEYSVKKKEQQNE